MSYNPPFGDELPLVFDAAYTAPNGNELAFNFYNGPLPDPVLARSDMAVPLDVVASAATTVRGASHPLLSFSFTVGVTAQVSCAGQVTANLTLSATASGGTEVRGAAGTDLHLTIAAIGGSRVSGTASCSFNLATSGSGFSTVIGAGAPQIAPSFTTAGRVQVAAGGVVVTPLSAVAQGGTTVSGTLTSTVPLVYSTIGLVTDCGASSSVVPFLADVDGIIAPMGAAALTLTLGTQVIAGTTVNVSVNTFVPLVVSASAATTCTGTVELQVNRPAEWAAWRLPAVSYAVTANGKQDATGAGEFAPGFEFTTKGIVGLAFDLHLNLLDGYLFAMQALVARTGTAALSVPLRVTGAVNAAQTVTGVATFAPRFVMTTAAGSTVSAIATPRIAPIITGVAAVTVFGASEAVVPLKVSAAAALDATGVCAATLRTGVAANGITLSPVSGQAEAELQIHVVAAGVRGTQGAVDVGAWIGVSGGGATCRIGEGFAALDFSVAAHGLRGASGVTEFPYLGVTATGVVASVFSGAALVHPQFSVAAGTDRAGGYLRGAFVKIETQQAVAHG